MEIKHDPTMQKEINKFLTIMFILIVILFFIGLYIGGGLLSLSGDYVFYFGFVFTLVIISPLFLHFLFKIQKKFPKEEIEQLKIQLKKYKKNVYLYLFSSLIPAIFSIILIFISVNLGVWTFFKVFPFAFMLLGLMNIIIGLNFKNNKEYYKISMFKMYGPNVEKQIQYYLKIFIYLGIGLILISILYLIMVIFIFYW